MIHLHVITGKAVKYERKGKVLKFLYSEEQGCEKDYLCVLLAIFKQHDELSPLFPVYKSQIYVIHFTST
jgi:hypothetical protein